MKYMFRRTDEKKLFIIWPKNDADKCLYYLDSDKQFIDSINMLEQELKDDDIDYEDYLKETNDVLKFYYTYSMSFFE